jgi:Domain of unknown function (DUF4382)
MNTRSVVTAADRRTHRAGRAAAWLGAACAALLATSGCTVKANYEVAAGSSASVSHLYVTVQEVWLATAADTPTEATSGWSKSVLPAPITIDLATISPGTLASLASAVSLSGGTYKQVHLVLADSGDALVSSAQSLGLANNAQITATDSSGVTTTTPLESPVPQSGITIATDLSLSGSFDFSQSTGSSSAAATTNLGGSTGTSGSGSTGTGTGTTGTTATTTSTDTVATSTGTTSTSSLAVVIDGGRDVLSYSYGANTGYLLSAIAGVIDEKNAGGISGTLDPSALPTGYGQIVVSAELPDATNTHHVVVRRAVVGADGTFALYPLPAPTSGTTNYDLVIASSSAETMLVRGIPVGANPITTPVVVQSTPLVLAAARPAYADVAVQATLLPGGARVMFYQTVSASGELPYAIDGTALDPVSHRLPGSAFALGAGPLMVGAYSAGDSVSFATLTPVEGNGGFVVGTEGLYRADTLARTPSVISGASGAGTPVVAPYPAIAAGGSAGTIALTISTTAGLYNSGFVVVSAGGRIVETVNVAALLLAGGGTVTIANLPAGGGLVPSGGVPYQLAVRAWNSNNATSSFTRVATTSSVVLGNGGVGSVSLQIP